jgi:hypothetical protein
MRSLLNFKHGAKECLNAVFRERRFVSTTPQKGRRGELGSFPSGRSVFETFYFYMGT